VIIANKDMADEVAYRLAKAIHENLDQFRKIHGSLVPYQLKDAVTGTGLPLHSGRKNTTGKRGL